MKFTKEQILGITRHILTFVGGILVTKGLMEEGMLTESIGSILTVIGAVWSIIAKK